MQPPEQAPILDLFLLEVAELPVRVARLEDPDQSQIIVRCRRQTLTVGRPAHAVDRTCVLCERREALRRIATCQPLQLAGCTVAQAAQRGDAAALTLSTVGSASAASLRSGAMLQILIVLSVTSKAADEGCGAHTR